MANVIKLLPDNISNQIAAGEVVQRPASAVKELLENSIDSGATEIKLIVKNAGKLLIQVTDNGFGMSEGDARMCFEKHATSKIQSVDDLFSIKTKGFRGEALASIAAIAQVELKTKKAYDQAGTRIIIEGSEVISIDECAQPTGTSVSVKNLFYNVPGRRKFLKSNTSELKHIIDEFYRIALAHPDIDISFYNDERLLYDVKPNKLRKRIVSLLGDNYNERLVPVEEFTDYVSIHGYIGKPEFAKKTRGEQFLFVNNRFIKSKYLNHAVYSAYKEIIQQNSYPMYILFLEIDPSRIDVNVHPSKHEINFDDERLVYTITNAGIKHALAQYSITPSIDFDVEQGFGSLPGFQNNLSSPHVISPQKPDVSNWEALYPERDTILTLESEDKTDDTKMASSTFKPYQLHKKYILTQIKSGFVLVDQQSAHERILYEEYLHKLQNKSISKQQLMFPTKVELARHEVQMLNSFKTEILDLGIEIESFGEDSILVQGVPPEVKPAAIDPLIENIVAHLEMHNDVPADSVHEKIARSLAVSASIKRGDYLTNEEIQNLIDRLFACSNPNISPNNNKCFIQFDLNEIDKKFLFAK